MTSKKYFFTVLILGLLSALSPLSIDMYLPGFPAIANSLHTSTAAVAISLSSFFVAVAVGQLIYGPLMDRYGRKKPLYIALIVYIAFSLACLLITSVQALIVLRSLQGLGSCAAGVAAMAMVKDLFPEKDNAKVFSFMVLVIGISPMLAPTIGSFLTTAYGWSSVFVVLSFIAAIILIATKWGIRENFSPDASFSLRPEAIAKNFIAVMRVPQFFTYSITVALAFAGMFGYIASSPTVFMVFFKVSGHIYGLIFACLSVGMIGSSLVSNLLLKYFSSKQIVFMAIVVQLTIASVFTIFAVNDWLGLYTTIGFLFGILCCIGITNPNATALSLMPFKKNSGTASSLMGFMQLIIGSLATYCTSLFKTNSPLPMCAIIFTSSLLAVGVLLFFKGKINHTTANI